MITLSINAPIKYFLIAILVLLGLLLALETKAQVDIWGAASYNPSVDELFWGGTQQNFSSNLGLGSFDPRLMVANFMNIAIGFLGILTVVMIMVAGFKWMLSGGNEDKIGEAKKMLVHTIIGTFLVLASFGIAKFFLGALTSATGIG